MPPPKTRLKLRAKMAAGRRLCVLRQIDDELVASLEQFLLVDDVVAVEDGAGGHMVACASRIPNSLAESRIEATLRGAWRLASSNEVGSHASLKGHTPLTFADRHMVARAELNNVR